MSNIIEIVSPDVKGAKYIKANPSLWRKFTRSKLGNGRNFSEDGFEADVLKGALPWFLYLCKNALPRSRKRLKGRVPLSDRIWILASDEIENEAKHIEKHLRPGGGIQFCANLAQFQTEVFRFMMKFIDHEDVQRFMVMYEGADIKTSQEFIDFFQAYVDKYHVEELDG